MTSERLKYILNYTFAIAEAHPLQDNSNNNKPYIMLNFSFSCYKINH